MREIEAQAITQAVRECCIEANTTLKPDLKARLNEVARTEVSENGRAVLKNMMLNIETAEHEHLPICQDTGMAIVFLDIGQDVHITGEALETAVNNGVAAGYRDGYLRKSVVADPFERVNTQDNTPAVIHTRIVPGEHIDVTVLPKGFGSENTSALKMLKPSDGMAGAEAFIVDTLIQAVPNGCAPLVAGIGIGGTFEQAALNAKRALTLPVEHTHDKPEYQALEARILEQVNNSGIGPMGLGGIHSLLAAHIIDYPTHIAGLPVAVNVCCYVDRVARRRL